MERKLATDWLDSEITYLKDNYNKLSTEDIAIHLNRTYSSIFHKATRLKLDKVEYFKQRKQISKEDSRKYRRNWALKKKYNLDSDDFYTLWIAFKGKCGICDCNLVFPEERKGQSLNVAVIDHNHKTGHLRGLLCNSCNKGIGLLKDDPKIVRKALNWLGE